jgi:hypothetical protein
LILLRLATDPRVGVSMSDLRTHHNILDVLDLLQMLDLRDEIEEAAYASTT